MTDPLFLKAVGFTFLTLVVCTILLAFSFSFLDVIPILSPLVVAIAVAIIAYATFVPILRNPPYDWDLLFDRAKISLGICLALFLLLRCLPALVWKIRSRPKK